MSCFTDIENKPDDWLVLDPLTIQKPIPKTGCDTNLIVLNYLSEFKTDALKQKVKDNLGLYVDNILSKNSTNPIANKTVFEAFNKFASSNVTKITWGSDSNMNNFKDPGIYEIYGERTRQDDNLPILNASSGHSIAARLTVIASTLQPANNEICVTQFLMLSNRKGGDGNMYVRTYNENNSPAADWWTPWQKLQGIREGYIFTDTVQVNPDGGVQQIDGVTGLNNMVDNGIYSGIYTDDPTFASPTFIDTFTLIAINNYAVAGKDERLKRTISQLKYAIDAITNQTSVKLRTKTDGGVWSNWTEIGGGNGDSQEIDITESLRSNKLFEIEKNLKSDITYTAKYSVNSPIKLDFYDKVTNKLNESGDDYIWHLSISQIRMHDPYTYQVAGYLIKAFGYTNTSSNRVVYHTFILSNETTSVKILSPMTEL